VRSPRGSLAGLARSGFLDVDSALAVLGPAGLGLLDPEAASPVDEGAADVLDALSRSGDPDLAVRALGRIAEQLDRAGAGGTAELVEALRASDRLRRRLAGVLGASASLGDHLVAHPQEWRSLEAPDEPEHHGPDALRRVLLGAVGAADDPDAPARGAGPDVLRDLRLAYRRCLLSVAARDLAGEVGLEAVAAELADLAGATLAAALAVARAGLPGGATPARLAVVALGKCGGRELNYVSDVDVLFVAEPGGPGVAAEPGEPGGPGVAAEPGGPGGPDVRGGPEAPARPDADPEPALRTATALAAELMRVCQAVAWPVDAALRPEGKGGPLVRTLASHEAYYDRWARTWEFQALLKARPVAGDPALGQRWCAMAAQRVWRAADRDGVVADVQAMRRRVEDHLPARDAVREIKLGRGGLRDIEFAVQLLQLVHGRGDESLRSGTTLVALAALTAGGYVGREDGEALAASYRFLRTVEHRLQLHRLRRTHRVPEDPQALRWLAQSLGLRPDARGDAVAVFAAEWGRHASEVRRLHEKLFYRPLLQAVARVPGDALRLTPDAARQRMEVLGFADPAGALRHLQALTGGVSRTAAIQRALLPAMLAAFAEAPDPDGGLLAYRRVSDRLGQTPWYLRFLRDEGLVAVRLAHLLGTSRYVADLMVRDPEALQMLADDAELVPRSGEALRATLRAAASRHVHGEAAVIAVRGLRRRELLRVACADLLRRLDITETGQALSDVTDAVLDAALQTAQRTVGEARGGMPTRLGVVAMGRLGGCEVGYSSDADVLFVHEPLEGADEREATGAAHAVAEELRRLLSSPAPDPPLGVDASLRPEGRQGPLVRSLAAYAVYYARWSSVWEAQALLRARPVAGDPDLLARFEALVGPVRYPEGGLSGADVVEIRRIKARVDTERLPRGADPATHTKLGPGGLADVEWTVQLLQLRHAHAVPGLRTTRTLAALDAAVEAGLVGSRDAEPMAAAWRLASRVRGARMLVRGRPSDQLPRQGPELHALVRALGATSSGDPGAFVDDYLRTMRRARAAVERVFHG